VTLDAGNGSIIWAKDMGTYIQQLCVDQQGRLLAVVGTFVCYLNESGDSTFCNSYGYGNPEGLTCGISPVGNIWVYSYTNVTITNETGSILASLYLGRYVRVIRVYYQTATGITFIATGSSDGIFSLLQVINGSVNITWQINPNPWSMTSDIQFSPDGNSVIFMMEVFNYKQRGNGISSVWKFRDVVEVYSLDGDLQWTSEGPWQRPNSYMGQLSLTIQNSNLLMAVLNSEGVRLVSSNISPVSNSYLFSTDNYDAPVDECDVIPPPLPPFVSAIAGLYPELFSYILFYLISSILYKFINISISY